MTTKPPSTERVPAAATPGSRARRRTIAMLMDYMAPRRGAYEAQFREALVAACGPLDLDVLLVYGGAIDHPSEGSGAQNAIFSLLHRERVDGLVVLSTTLASFCGPARLSEYLQGLREFPLCSVGVALPGIPSLVVDNQRTMEAIVEHLVGVHGVRRPVYLGGTPGNAEAQIRAQAFHRVLERHGLSARPELMAVGNFMTITGHDTMVRIIESGAQFDAVIAANDNMALGALQALRRHGFRAPRDLLISGFDDSPGAAMAKPSLTTVAQPFTAMAEGAVHTILEQLEGRAVPEVWELPATLVIRRSCGCGGRPSPSKPVAQPGAHDAAQLLLEHGPSMEARMHEFFAGPGGGDVAMSQRILDGLQAELSGEPGKLVDALEQILDDWDGGPELSWSLHRAVRFLREQLQGLPQPVDDDLWHAARDIIEHSTIREVQLHREEVDDAYARVLDGGESVSRSLDPQALKNALLMTLPLMRIDTALVSRFVGHDARELEALFWVRDGKQQPTNGQRYPSFDLTLPGYLQEGKRRVTAVFPLTIGARQLGVLAFEYVERQIGQQLLRHQISAALSSVHLHEEVVAKTAQHERSVQERLATAKRMQSLSVLAGGVAHDLNNVLGPLVALPDVILRELDEQACQQLPANLRADLESIKVAALSASETIRDLLTLGRRGRTSKAPLDLCRLLRSSEPSDPLRVMLAGSPKIKLCVELPRMPVVIYASEPHLVRALANLVHNAKDALGDEGELNVKLSVARLSQPVSGYETIEAGDYAVLTVSDNGCGIPEYELGRIFEPFFSSKRVDEQRGSGLGLAIVHGVVKEHDGFIDLASKAGLGTTFSLYFPRADALAKVSIPPESPLQRGHARILVVDDEPVQLRTCRRVLGSLGYKVDCLASGREALERFEAARSVGDSSPYDLVILDMILNEDLDGLDRFEQIVRSFPRQRAIVVSGHAPPERAEQAFQQGLAWLAKPYTADALSVAVRTALESESGRTPIRIASKPPSARAP
ncbi:MAG: substrate-binding domain-containing protein [Polyangiaceae bacterium]